MKVMLDECLTLRPSRVVIEYLKLYRPPIEAHFLIDFMRGGGARDDDWTNYLQPPEDWIVITADSGRKAWRIHAKGPPLHLILPRRRITGFYMRGKTMTQCTGFDRARVIIAEMPKILKAAETATPGDRFVVKTIGGGVGVEPWPFIAQPSASEPPQPS